MGGCQNYGPFWGPYYNTAPIIYGTHERDPNDNHPDDLLHFVGPGCCKYLV